VFNPRTSGFREIGATELKINNINSPRTVFLQMGIFPLACFLFVQMVLIITERNIHAFTIWFENFGFLNVIFFACVILPLFAFFIGLRYKPMFTIFHSDTGHVSFHSEKINFSIPFSAVRFATERNSTGKGISIIAVIVYAIYDVPFHSGPIRRLGGRFKKTEALLEQSGEIPHYETVLCSYNAGSEADADESIDYLRFFMEKKPGGADKKTEDRKYISAY
jgi:hypothetical protein